MKASNTACESSVLSKHPENIFTSIRGKKIWRFHETKHPQIRVWFQNPQNALKINKKDFYFIILTGNWLEKGFPTNF
jgi:hypothetical protein